MKSPCGHSRSVFLSTAVVILIVLTTANTAWAQKDMGSIVGLVKDGTGAVVADARVTITDVDRGTVIHTTTNAGGEYVAGPMRIGQYTVTVEKAGFKRAVAGPVSLNVQDRVGVDIIAAGGGYQRNDDRLDHGCTA